MRMRALNGLSGCLGLLAVTVGLAVLAEPNAHAALGGETVSSPRTTAARLRVGSYNIRNVRHDVALFPGESPWRVRRPAVIRDILGERVHVLGVQEASQNRSYGDSLVDGATQYLDLRNGLNAAGGAYQLTDTRVESTRQTRILYDTRAVSLVRRGYYEYRTQSALPHDDRYLVWAVFREKVSGIRFFFANTHLVNRSQALQRAQWSELIDKVNDLRGDLPTIVVGDFQHSKFKHPTTEMMMRMKSAGYGDVVGQRPRDASGEHRRARRVSRGWLNTKNSFNRDVADWSHETDRSKLGNNIDWIFASNELPVRRWKVVADVDPDTLRLEGVIPSDHNMVRATLVLR